MRCMNGQSSTEFLVLTLVLLPLFLIVPLLGKQLDIAHAAASASRYVAFEGTVRNGGSLQPWKSDAELAADIALLPTDALAPGDLHVGWTEGALVRDTGAICRAMQDALAGLGLLDPAPVFGPSSKEYARVQ